jgi:ABC-type Fe3+ transport system substrate-binding protein
MMDFWNPDAPENQPLVSVTVFGVEVKAGDRVRLWPQKSADILDMAMKGKVAIVEAIERDYDDQVHLAVVLEDDPGRDFGMLRQPGHRFFFPPEEVEPLALNGEVTNER